MEEIIKNLSKELKEKDILIKKMLEKAISYDYTIEEGIKIIYKFYNKE